MTASGGGLVGVGGTGGVAFFRKLPPALINSGSVGCASATGGGIGNAVCGIRAKEKRERQDVDDCCCVFHIRKFFEGCCHVIFGCSVVLFIIGEDGVHEHFR
ncbi:MAG: hypothetical protein LBR07_06520 [Puniceicoccales bacterium]|nr:hypothetical protein [Puniceicoccales bacterium]